MSNVPTQSSLFSALGLPQHILNTVQALGYETATPVQAQAIPILLRGDDLVGVAQTGTGKTAAFALPTLTNIEVNSRALQALVLCPTRELSQQVAEAFRSYGKNLPGLRVATIVGGKDFKQQIRDLESGAHVVVATPGRLIDHMERGRVDFSTLRTVVLDEADEMLRMGFIDDVETILSKTPDTRQVALLSATMPPPIRKIADRYLKDAYQIEIASQSTTNADIEQFFWFAKGMSKQEALERLLHTETTDATIVFVRTRQQTTQVADELQKAGFNAGALNGDMDQNQRTKAVADLKRGSLDILVATDVAARGLDVTRISHVINFDIPFDPEAYVHRIGRTGRAGRHGRAFLFVTPRDRRLLRLIERVTGKQIEECQMPNKAQMAQAQTERFIVKAIAALKEAGTESFTSVIDEICKREDVDYRTIAAAMALLANEGRTLVAPKSARQDKSDRHEKSERAPKARHNDRHAQDNEGHDAKRAKHSAAREDNPKKEKRAQKKANSLSKHPDILMERFSIGLGSNQGLLAKDLVRVIGRGAGIEREFIGDIEIHEDFTTIDLPEGMPKAILKDLRRSRVNGQLLDIKRG